MKRILLGWMLGIGVFGMAATGWGQTMPVPDTGQTTCYDAAGTVIPCPSPGQAFHGQDGNYNINPPSYTNMSSGVVRDNVTGLYWEVKRNKDNVQNYSDPRDADNTYTWCDTNPDTNGGNQGTCGDHDTMDFISGLNDAGLGGFHDWRMPTFDELRSIVDYGRYNPAINTTYFPNTVASNYWSATTYAGSTSCAWDMNFIDGHGYDYIHILHKSNGLYVRAVRGGQ